MKTYCDEYGRLNRRDFLWQGLQGAAGLFWGNLITGAPLPQIALADPHVGPRGDTLVCVFLRGGADGLNMVIPFGDDAYYDLRPTINIPRPDDRRAEGQALDLDGFFGLHPALSPLLPLYSAGDLALIQATGSPDESRSHFEAMDLMERGAVPGAYTGWLARHLSTLDTGNESPLRGVAIENRLPLSMAGGENSVPIPDFDRYQLNLAGDREAKYSATLRDLYTLPAAGLLQSAAQQTFDALELIAKVESNQGRSRAGRQGNPFSQSLQTVAHLIEADVGVEVAALDYGGWDTHVNQGGLEGQMANLLGGLAEGLASFYESLGDKRERVTVVVMSEFGRRAGENAGLGTDHGHGNMMMVLGGQINGGQVFANWPGLHRDLLVGPGDLAITTDYRNVLGEIIAKRLNNPLVDQIFPDYEVAALGLA
ncbi:MAG: DUF1501 domain-containing protein [Ardenticatenaceae bacterium]|nr:DUF1501 domain-containing protein [Ardenticatenaceae bacterium]